MANELENPVLVEDDELDQEDTLSERFMDWVRTELVWYAGSFTFHLFLISLLLLFGSPAAKIVVDSVAFKSAQQAEPEKTDKRTRLPRTTSTWAIRRRTRPS